MNLIKLKVISSSSGVTSATSLAQASCLSHLHELAQVSRRRGDRDTKLLAVLPVCECMPLIYHQPQRFYLPLVQTQCPQIGHALLGDKVKDVVARTVEG